MTPQRGILLTGFEPFASYAVNSSQQVMEAISKSSLRASQLVCEILPVAYQAAADRMRALIAQHRPRICICTGLNDNADAVMLEQRAQNLDDTDCGDNAGEIRRWQIISPNGPSYVEANLPFAAISAALARHQIPSRLSQSAGNFVCNHVFYIVAELLRATMPDACFGFIHLPPCAELKPAGRGMPLSQLTLAVRVIIEACEDGLRGEKLRSTSA